MFGTLRLTVVLVVETNDQIRIPTLMPTYALDVAPAVMRP
jgi:hypothetical protein